MASGQARKAERTSPASDAFRVRALAAALPKGGSAIRGIGEEFTAVGIPRRRQ
jgi:hypothetical protein